MSDNVNFAEYIANERGRLRQRRDELLASRGNLDNQLTALDTEFAAIDAYERAKTGKAIVRGGKAATRVRRGSRREEIISVLGAAPRGMKRGELLDKVGVKGDKSAEMSVSNALSALYTKGQITRGQDGRWAVVSAEGGLRRAAE